jgi:2-dehydro-3-deoxy-D-arabinonate dehydratase
MHRTPAELLGYLYRCENHPDGAVLSTGTGIVPGVEFSLRAGDLVTIVVDEVATLVNPVVVGKEKLAFLTDPIRPGVDRAKLGFPPSSPSAAEAGS